MTSDNLSQESAWDHPDFSKHDDNGTGGCEGSFVIYDDDDNMVAPGAVENLELVSVTCDDDGEPQEACFRTNFCDLHYVVKAGRGTEEVTVSLDDGSIDDNGEFCVTGIEGQNPAGKSVTYAISNIVFTCPPSEE